VATLPVSGAASTAIVRGVNNATGVALVEVYPLNYEPTGFKCIDPAATSSGRSKKDWRLTPFAEHRAGLEGNQIEQRTHISRICRGDPKRGAC
jgi:hypothetical protein